MSPDDRKLTEHEKALIGIGADAQSRDYIEGLFRGLGWGVLAGVAVSLFVLWLGR